MAFAAEIPCSSQSLRQRRQVILTVSKGLVTFSNDGNTLKRKGEMGHATNCV